MNDKELRQRILKLQKKTIEDLGFWFPPEGLPNYKILTDIAIAETKKATGEEILKELENVCKNGVVIVSDGTYITLKKAKDIIKKVTSADESDEVSNTTKATVNSTSPSKPTRKEEKA